MPQLDPTFFVPQLVWLAITFVVLLLLMWRIALPKVGEVVVMREDRIQGNLKSAESLKVEAEAAIAEYHKAIADARAAAQAEHSRIAAVIADETTKREATFAKRLDETTSAAEKRIAAAKSEALASVRSISAELAQAMAQKLVGAQISGGDAAGAVDAVIKEHG